MEMMTITQALRKGIKLGIDLARDNPDKPALELIQDCDNMQTFLKTLPDDVLEEIINGTTIVVNKCGNSGKN